MNQLSETNPQTAEFESLLSESLSASNLNDAAKKKGKLGQRARFAKTLKKIRG